MRDSRGCSRRSTRRAVRSRHHADRRARPAAPQQLNMQPQVINEYEQGKGVPNNAIIAKIEKALGAKLPRVKK